MADPSFDFAQTAYPSLLKTYQLKHEEVNHAAGEFVRLKRRGPKPALSVHTGGIDCTWKKIRDKLPPGIHTRKKGKINKDQQSTAGTALGLAGKEPGDEFHVALPPPPQSGPACFLLTVPEDKKGGDELFFDANGQHMRAIIPEGRQPGDTFEVHLGPSQLLVTVPEGRKAGEEIEIQGPGGLMKAVVPKGIKASERFAVSLVNDPALHSGLPALCTACSHGDLEEAQKLVAASNLSVNGCWAAGRRPAVLLKLPNGWWRSSGSKGSS
ncbi:unnamed protein product [Cladocopium goreaui]|uniref:Uncharacterized protein n=1 Tax=Cladocopium goreaui TaxID=2562237 RepID=A0A9P1FIU2_9DINO|nr:unnamed protein product [Cladocopium goreaui]